MSEHDTITICVDVPLSPAHAFVLFTERIDAWWKRGPQYRFRSPWTTGRLEFVPGDCGRLIERYPDGEVLEIGRVSRWDPPRGFSLQWRLPIFEPAEVTHVEVSFRAVSMGCRVEVRHSGWTHLRPDHPARHGLDDARFLNIHGRLWGDLLNALRATAFQHDSLPTSGERP
jgi:Activator of Hsp90 ATPase homolog 1-like protein